MKRETTGEYYLSQTGEEQVRAFIPCPLPPAPAIEMGPKLVNALADTMLALGRLNSLRIAPDYSLFLYQYVRKEAVLSSKIEGTQSTLADLLAHEDADTPGVPLDDVLEVSNYVAAMEYGKKRVMVDGFPISSRLMREIHTVLLTSGRGSDKNPGEFKRSQNWLGGTRPGNAQFVPTPPHETAKCISELEQFIHDDRTGLHTLLKAGLVHVQFETIHPFLDGNGRIGRMLVPLMLMQAGILDESTLYLSLYLKAYRSEYYALLQSVRETGDWESWLLFFLEGVQLVALDAVHVADSIQETYQRDRQKLIESGKNSKVVIQVHECMMVRQAANPKRISAQTGLSMPSVMRGLRSLMDEGIVEETTGRQRNTRYKYTETCAVLANEVGSFKQKTP
ncbi:MAG: Fic family protein [Desulfovibrionaceae bacterium]